MNEATAERPHHPYSPSSLQYRELSPYWTNETKEATEASLAGTAQHNAAEKSVDLDDPELNDKEAEAVQKCKEFRDSRIAAMPGCTVFQEVYLPIDDRTVEGHLGTTGGYADLVIVSADKLYAEVIDWKFGLWSVEPTENNLQGMAYLLGAFKRNPNLESATVYFCSPHRDEIDSHTFKRSEFDTLMLRVKTVVERAMAAKKDGDTSKCTPHVSTCLWCGNKGHCQALAAFALKVGKKYSPPAVPDEINPSLMLKAEYASQTMEIAMLMKMWGEAVRARITEKCVDEDETAWMPKGYKLASRANRKVVNYKKVVEIAKASGATEKAIDEAMAVTMEPLNKSIRAANPRGQKEAAEINFRNKCIDEGGIEEKPDTIFLERIKD